MADDLIGRHARDTPSVCISLLFPGMDLRIEPLLTPITHTPPRRVEPIDCASPAPPYGWQAKRPADPIRFADYLEKSNLTYPARPFWAERFDDTPRPDSHKPDPQPTRPRSSVPKIGDVSPVEEQRVTQHYHKVMRMQRTIELGSIVDIVS